MKFPLVSITITTKNEENNIGLCLQSIKQQTYPQNKIEIIVVDNNSIDQTKKIAKKFTKNVFNFGPERSAQRNFGMLKKSHGKYLMFLDADMSLSSRLIEKAINKLEHSNLSALYIQEIIIGNSFWSKVRNFERSFYNATVIDCVRIIRKEVFIKVQGFDETLTGPEDWDLDKRIRDCAKVGLLNNTNGRIYHHEKFNFKQYLSKKVYYVKSFAKYIKKWGKNDPDIQKQFGLWYRYFGVFIKQGKWEKLISHPFLATGLFFLKFVLGIIFLNSQLSKNHK